MIILIRPILRITTHVNHIRKITIILFVHLPRNIFNATKIYNLSDALLWIRLSLLDSHKRVWYTTDIFILQSNTIFQSFCHMSIDSGKFINISPKWGEQLFKIVSNVIHQNHLFNIFASIVSLRVILPKEFHLLKTRIEQY